LLPFANAFASSARACRERTAGRTCCPTTTSGRPSHLPVAPPPTPLCPDRSKDLAATAA
jgi:hypothetical protein